MLNYKKLYITCENKTASQWYIEDIQICGMNMPFISLTNEYAIYFIDE